VLEGKTFFLLITVLDVIGAIILFLGALSPRMRLYPAWHRIGLLAAVVGLFAQAGRNIEYMFTGISPNDADLPLWALKDLGIDIIAYTYAGRGILSWLDKDKQPGLAAATPVKAKTTTKPAVTKPVARKPNARKVTK
jgi:hypothetical protein